MKATRWIHSLLALAALAGPAGAEDIDIFTANPLVAGTRPNILIVLDNSANWSANFDGGTKFSKEMETLATVVGGLTDRVNVGIMLFGETGSGNSNPVTAYVRSAVRQMAATNKAGLVSLVNGLNINGDKGSNAPYGFAMFEAYKYFGGGGTSRTPQNASNYGSIAFGGAGQKKRDYAGNAVANTAGSLAGNAFASAASTSYVSPVTDACQKNYVIFISNGLPPSGSDSGNPSASTLLQNVGGAGSVTTIPLSNNTAQGSIGDEYARFLYQADVSELPGRQNIITYTVNVYDSGSVNGNDRANIVLLQSMANQGRGRYFAATSAQKLADALNSIINEVQAVDSVFASVTLPVSVNPRGTTLNQVYMGIFRPDADAAPRWKGNLKQYQLAVNTSTNSIFLADQTGLGVESPATGFVVDNAQSFWTSASTFWSFQPSGNPPSASDSPDGAVVEKGGAAQRIRDIYPNPDSTSAQTRKIYTCTTGCLATASATLSSYPFNTTTIGSSAAAVSAFNAADSTELANLINWVRGQDNAVDENLDGSFTDIRPSVHGDVLHSRPAVINYNRYGDNNDVTVFYGSNDGLFRAIKGGRNTSDGYEKWAFVPMEFWGKFKRLRDNSPIYTAAAPRPYFFDGAVGVYQYDANSDGRLVAADGDKVYVFLSMRRGGRGIYALDVSDPDNPKFMWRRDSSSPGYSELGQTWSEPKVRRIRATSAPVLIFGAGYDAAVEDQDPVPTGVVNSMGRGIFVVNALTGDPIWQAGPASPSTLATGETFLTVADMTYAIPSDVAALDRNNDGYVDRLYVGDTGGQIWRADINDALPANWTVNKLASVGFAANGTVASRRKFLHSPDVVYGSDGNGAFDAVLIGSGDREHPFNGYGTTEFPLSNAVQNRYYMFKDRSIGFTYSASTIVESGLYDATANLIQDGTAAERAAATTALTGARGWYMTLGTGEKVVSSSVTLGNAVYFNTNQPVAPAAGVCTTNLGVAREYTVSFLDGSAVVPYNASAGLAAASRYQLHAGGGFLPSPVPVIAEIGGRLYQTVIVGTSALMPPTSPLQARIRTFWYRR